MSAVLIKRKFGYQDMQRGKMMLRDIERRWPSTSQELRPGTDPFLTGLRKTNPAST